MTEGVARSRPASESEIYIRPDWPDGNFYLRAIDGGWELGPCTKDLLEILADGSLGFSGVGHPVHLRVRRQVNDLIFANNGSMGPMVYRIIPEPEDPSAAWPDDQLVLVYDKDDRDEADRAWRRRTFYAVYLLWNSVHEPLIEDTFSSLLQYAPSQIASAARRQLRGIDSRQNNDAAVHLVRAARELVYLAKMAWWPWSMTGDLGLSPDEKPREVIDERMWDDSWLGFPPRSRRLLYREARSALDRLVAAAERLEASGPECVTTREVETTAYGAVEWTQNLLMLAVDVDLEVVTHDFRND